MIESSSWAVLSMAVDVAGEVTTSLECTCRSELDATGRICQVLAGATRQRLGVKSFLQVEPGPPHQNPKPTRLPRASATSCHVTAFNPSPIHTLTTRHHVHDSLAARPGSPPPASPLRHAHLVRAAVAGNGPVGRDVARARRTLPAAPKTLQPRRPPRILQAPRASHRGGRLRGARQRPRRPGLQRRRVRRARRGQQRPGGHAAPVHAGRRRGQGLGRREEGPRVRQLQQVDYGDGDDPQGNMRLFPLFHSWRKARPRREKEE